jgi:hypothetical protein
MIEWTQGCGPSIPHRWSPQPSVALSLLNFFHTCSVLGFPLTLVNFCLKVKGQNLVVSLALKPGNDSALGGSWQDCDQQRHRHRQQEGVLCIAKGFGVGRVCGRMKSGWAALLEAFGG